MSIVCGAVQLAGTASLIAPLVAIPPVATVYVRTSVLAAEPAVAVVGLIEAVPEPSLDGFTVTLRPDGAVPRATKPRVPPLDAQATGCADMDRKLPNKNNRLFIPNLDEAAVAMGTVVRKDAAMSATIRLTGGELSVDDLGGCVEYRRPDGTAVQPKHSMASGIEGILYEWRGLPATSVMLVRTDAAGVEKADALRPNANGLIVLRVSSFAASAMSRLAPYAIAHFKAHFDGAFKTIDERRRVSLWWLETYKTSPGIDCPPGGTGP